MHKHRFNNIYTYNKLKKKKENGRPRAKGGGLLVLSGNSIVRPIGAAKDMKETLFEGLSNQRTHAICCGT